jgi:hypothetical protein
MEKCALAAWQSQMTSGNMTNANHNRLMTTPGPAPITGTNPQAGIRANLASNVQHTDINQRLAAFKANKVQAAPPIHTPTTVHAPEIPHVPPVPRVGGMLGRIGGHLGGGLANVAFTGLAMGSMLMGHNPGDSMTR